MTSAPETASVIPRPVARSPWIPLDSRVLARRTGKHAHLVALVSQTADDVAAQVPGAAR
jgi:hypothetical protein